MTTAPLSWEELETLTDYQIDTVNGFTNAKARLRLFGKPENVSHLIENRYLNLVHFETWSNANSIRLIAHAEVLPATTIGD